MEDTVGPKEFFARHRILYGLTLAGPVTTSAYAINRMRRAPNRRQMRAYCALAALTTVQAIGLIRIRPSRKPDRR